jgi:hypothetical protein
MCKRIHEPASERRRRLEKICSHEKQPHPETMLKNDAENPFLIDYHG